jgi:hypothetical protein
MTMSNLLLFLKCGGVSGDRYRCRYRYRWYIQVGRASGRSRRADVFVCSKCVEKCVHRDALVIKTHTHM